MALIIGTTHADLLVGTDSDDIIYGLDGHDFMSGGNGNDSLYGGVHYPAAASAGAYAAPPPSAPRPAAHVAHAASKKAAPAKPKGDDIQVYRGTKGDNYTVGG